jgi:hypothetical protein
VLNDPTGMVDTEDDGPHRRILWWRAAVDRHAGCHVLLSCRRLTRRLRGLRVAAGKWVPWA